MGYGHLPKIEDERFYRSLARLQSNDDFRDFKKWLFSEGKKYLLSKIVDKPNDNKLEIGFLQGLSDLEDLWNSAFEYARKFENLRLKKNANL